MSLLSNWKWKRAIKGAKSTEAYANIYDAVADNQGKVLRVVGEHIIDHPLKFTEGHTALCGERGAILKMADGYEGLTFEVVNNASITVRNLTAMPMMKAAFIPKMDERAEGA